MKHHQGYRCHDCGIEDGKHIPLVGIKPQVQTKWFFEIINPSFNHLGFVYRNPSIRGPHPPLRVRRLRRRLRVIRVIPMQYILF